MASRPRRGRKTEAAEEATGTPADRIIDATMALLAGRRFHEIGLEDIATVARLPLAEVRREFEGKIAILAAFSKRIDLAVLEAGPAEAGDSARDRLFEVMMRRFDALAPYKTAIGNLAKAARRDPCLALILHTMALGSQKWTLAAAGIHRRGPLGGLVLEGTVLAQAEALRAWLDDDDPGLAGTMAALDKALRRGERVMGVVSEICSFFPRMARRTRDAGAAEPAPAG